MEDPQAKVGEPEERGMHKGKVVPENGAENKSVPFLAATFRRHTINPRVIADLRRRSTLGFFFYIAVPYCIFLTNSYYQRHPLFTVSSLVIFTIICLARLFHQVKSLPRDTTSSLRNYRIFFVGVVSTAVTWGIISATALTQDGEPEIQLLMAICTAGFCSGGVIAFIPDRTLSILYNLLLLVPVVIFLLVKGTYVGLGVAIALYSMYLVLITLRGNSEYWTALENEHLLEEKSNELRLQSRTDSLTGLINRRHFDELFHLALGICMRQKSYIALIMVDIDHFKTINDTWGHLAGDEYIRLVSALLSKVFQRQTDIIGRFGGEEFVILLIDKDPSKATAMAESFRKEVANSVLQFKDEEIRTTVSLGLISCLPHEGLSTTAIIEAADQLLYAAKSGGRNRLITSSL